VAARRNRREPRHSAWEIACEALVLALVFVTIFWGVPLTLCVADLRYCP
jgi:hypothetical protein